MTKARIRIMAVPRTKGKPSNDGPFALHYAGNGYFKTVEEMQKRFVDHLPIEEVVEAFV